MNNLGIHRYLKERKKKKEIDKRKDSHICCILVGSFCPELAKLVRN